MQVKLEVGLSWDHVKVYGTGHGDRKIELGNGITEKYFNVLYWKLRCDCGKEFVIWDRDWRAKKYVKDCGCGMSLKDGETVIMLVSAKSIVRQNIKRYAAANGLSLSRAIVELVNKGLAVVVNDELLGVDRG